ncbi:hypothetical protein ACOCJ5_16295 [Knoellia sp. CPCC 206450]|uniref:hypothetical protein n=1 Tax=Knoellia tibetensis TaxID=3404798 RepID=UPI003B42E61E
MTWWSRRVSPVRFLLCAVFMGIAFILASWTSARADDKGLLASVTESAPTVGKVVVSTSAAVPVAELEPVVAPVVAQVEKAVEKPVAAVEKVVEKPVAAVDRTTVDVVETTSKTVSDTTARVTDTVKDVVPVTAAVVDPVVDVVDVVVPEAPLDEPAPLPDLPGLPGLPDVPVVADDVDLDAVRPEGSRASSSGPAAAAGGTSASEVSGLGVPTTPTVLAQSAADVTGSPTTVLHAPTAVAGVTMRAARAAASPAERLPAGAPQGPLAVTGGSAPALGGASSSGAPDAGPTPSSFELPLLVPLAVSSEQSCHAPGPCSDPGSRPG